MKTYNENTAINEFGEIFQKRYLQSPTWDFLTIERVGGMDNNPKFRATMNYDGNIATEEAYTTKKVIKKRVVAKWLNEYGTYDI